MNNLINKLLKSLRVKDNVPYSYDDFNYLSAEDVIALFLKEYINSIKDGEI